MIFQQAYAVTSGDSILNSTMSFGDFILLAISIFVLLAGVLSIIFILWGGLLLVLSGGKDDKIKPAINTIRYAVIGIVVTVLTIFLFPILGSLLGLDVDKYAKPQRIFEKIDEIGNRVFGGTTSSSSPSINNTSDGFPSDFSDL